MGRKLSDVELERGGEGKGVVGTAILLLIGEKLNSPYLFIDLDCILRLTLTDIPARIASPHKTEL